MLDELSSVKNALAVLILALVVALYVFANSPYFETDQIEWTGLVQLSPEQLNAYLNMPVINVWRVDARELAALLTRHPWIQSAKVKWRWPNCLLISIQERTPVAQVPIEGGWVFLDREGQLLPPMENRLLPDLPIVTNVDLEVREQLMATARLITLIPAHILPSISEWNAQERVFVTRSGVEIAIGEPVELADKVALLEQILQDLQARGERPERIDLSVLKTPVVTLVR